MSAGLVAKDLTVRLGGHEVVRDVSIEVAPGEWVAVIGPNGAGKSTLLGALSGALAHRGRVEVAGIDTGRLAPRARAQQIALVPQTPVVPEAISVRDYVLLGRTPHLGMLGIAGRHDRVVTEEVLAELDLVGLADRRVDSLSGGERQRVVIGRALAQDTPVVLLDEPTSALDIGHQQEVLELLDRLRRERRLAVLTTLHDLTIASRYPDRLMLLVGGRSVAAGTPVEVLTEDLLARSYGAAVRVLCTEDGLAIIPRRPI